MSENHQVFFALGTRTSIVSDKKKSLLTWEKTRKRTRTDLSPDQLELPITISRLSVQMDASNAIGIYRFASDHNCLLLKSAAFAFICNNFVHVATEEEFVDIPKDILIQLLSSEQLHVDSEHQVRPNFEAQSQLR